METFSPGQTIIFNVPDLPPGEVVGYQLQKAATGSTTIGRTINGVIERPAGLGNYVLNFVAPAEGDVYLLIVDWSGGVLAPETSKVFEIKVTAQPQPGTSGLGAIADYVQMNVGGEAWNGIKSSIKYGDTYIQLAIDTVKRRATDVVITTNDEQTLDPLVLDYFGVLASLELVPALRDYWANQIVSQSVGDSPAEIVTYPNRAALVDELRDDLMRKLARTQALAMTLISSPRARVAGDGPDIDELTDDRVTDDPRDFPQLSEFPFDVDVFRTGVQL